MNSAERKEESTLSVNQINNIIFSTLYKRKISIKDWFYTKIGFLVLAIAVYMFFTDSLGGQNIAILFATVLFLYNRETTLAHEKENTIWLLKLRKRIFSNFEETYRVSMKKKSKSSESSEILENCKHKKD